MLLLAMLVIVLALCKQFLPASQASVGGALENALAKRRRAHRAHLRKHEAHATHAVPN